MGNMVLSDSHVKCEDENCRMCHGDLSTQHGTLTVTAQAVRADKAKTSPNLKQRRKAKQKQQRESRRRNRR